MQISAAICSEQFVSYCANVHGPIIHECLQKWLICHRALCCWRPHIWRLKSWSSHIRKASGTVTISSVFLTDTYTSRPVIPGSLTHTSTSSRWRGVVLYVVRHSRIATIIQRRLFTAAAVERLDLDSQLFACTVGYLWDTWANFSVCLFFVCENRGLNSAWCCSCDSTDLNIDRSATCQWVLLYLLTSFRALDGKPRR